MLPWEPQASLRSWNLIRLTARELLQPLTSIIDRGMALLACVTDNDWEHGSMGTRCK